MSLAPGLDDRQCLADSVRASLRSVIDPELGENLIDLGLIYFVAVDDRATAHVVMTTTTPGCPAVSYLKDAVQRAAVSVSGVRAAEAVVTYDPPWHPDMMTGSEGRRRPTAKPRSWRPW
jgi:metal-sulfur cluster biosynthetic enzyme